MIQAGRQMDEVPFLQVQSDPSVLICPDLEESAACSHQPDLWVIMQVLVSEYFRLRRESYICQLYLDFYFTYPFCFNTLLLPFRKI